MIVIYFVIVFIVVLFIYLHVQFQLSTSSEEKIYDIEVGHNKRIDDVLDLKQPVVLHTTTNLHISGDNNLFIQDSFNRKSILHAFKENEICILDNTSDDINTVVSSTVESANDLFNADKKGIYYTESNKEIIDNLDKFKIGALATYYKLLKPPLCSNNIYDIIFGSDHVTTRAKYSIMFRNYFLVTDGEVEIRLVAPDNVQFENTVSKYETFEYVSKDNLWDITDTPNSITAVLKKGECMYIPPYWLYSFKLSKSAVIVSSRYNSYLTELATIHHKLTHLFHKTFSSSIPIFPDVHKDLETEPEIEIEMEEQEKEDEIEIEEQELDTDAKLTNDKDIEIEEEEIDSIQEIDVEQEMNQWEATFDSSEN